MIISSSVPAKYRFPMTGFFPSLCKSKGEICSINDSMTWLTYTKWKQKSQEIQGNNLRSLQPHFPQGSEVHRLMAVHLSSSVQDVGPHLSICNTCLCTWPSLVCSQEVDSCTVKEKLFSIHTTGGKECSFLQFWPIAHKHSHAHDAEGGHKDIALIWSTTRGNLNGLSVNNRNSLSFKRIFLDQKKPKRILRWVRNKPEFFFDEQKQVIWTLGREQWPTEKKLCCHASQWPHIDGCCVSVLQVKASFLS